MWVQLANRPKVTSDRTQGTQQLDLASFNPITTVNPAGAKVALGVQGLRGSYLSEAAGTERGSEKGKRQNKEA